MAGWKDITSYAKSDTTRQPATFEWAAPDVNIIVTRIHGVPGRWHLRCARAGFGMFDLGADLEPAKRRALVLVADRLTKMADYVRHAISNADSAEEAEQPAPQRWAIRVTNEDDGTSHLQTERAAVCVGDGRDVVRTYDRQLNADMTAHGLTHIWAAGGKKSRLTFSAEPYEGP